jgi:hypothetical protein
LQGEIHFLPGRDRLGELDLQRRFALDSQPIHDFHGDMALADVRDARLAFSAASVEHADPIAGLQAQHPCCVVRGLFGQFRHAAWG